MKRLTVEKPVREMDMMELAHNCMYSKKGWAWYRDFDNEKDLMELIREINVVIGGSELPENNTLLEEVLQENLQYSLSDKDGLIAFIYQSLWTKANLRERLKKYEDTDLTPERITEINDFFNSQTAKILAELQEYQRAKEEGRLHIIPDIKLHKTLYWIWGGEIMPVKYSGINGGCIDDKGKFHITCKMRTKKERKFIYKKKNILVKKGDARCFYADDIGKDVFLSRKEAEAKLAEMEGGHV